MNATLKNKLLPMGLIIISCSMLTACYTIKGTVTGAGRDIQTVANTVTPCTTCHHRHYHHRHIKTTKNKYMTKQTSSGVKSTQTTKQTNTSY